MRSAKIFATAFFFLCLPACAQEVRKADPGSITVNGEAEVLVTPSEVVLDLGVVTQKMNMIQGKHEQDQKIKGVIAAAKQVGIADKDIQTDYLSIEPQYREEYNSELKKQERIFTGFLHRTSIVITQRELSRFNDLLMGVLASGATIVHGIDFRTNQLRKYRDQARSMAIKAAKEKAMALAGDLGQKVGRAKQISEGYNGWLGSYGRGWEDRDRLGGRFQTQATSVAGMDAPVSENVLAPGTISVQAHVSVIFDLE